MQKYKPYILCFSFVPPPFIYYFKQERMNLVLHPLFYISFSSILIKWKQCENDSLLLVATVLLSFLSFRIYSINHPGRLLHFWTLRVGSYSRLGAICLFCNKTINGNNKTRRCNKARFLYNTLKKTPSSGKSLISTYSISISHRDIWVETLRKIPTFSKTMNLENVASRINNDQYCSFSGVGWGVGAHSRLGAD